MRFDYQPALVNVRILKTSKQRKLFLLAAAGVIGCLIIVSAIAHSVANFSNKSAYTYSQVDVSHSLNILPPTVTQANLSNDSPKSNLPTTVADDKSVEQQTIAAVNPEPEWRAIKIQPGDTLTSILQNLSMPAVHLKDLNNFIKTNVACKAIANIRSGQSIKVLFDSDNNLKTIKVTLAAHKTLLIDQVGPRNYKIHHEEKPIIKKLSFARNKISGSFYAAAQAAGLNETLIMEMADIFGWDIDFTMDIRPNDKFRILYEEKFVENEKIGTGHILAAEFVNQGQTYQAVRFTDTQGRNGYYTPEGYSMNKTFLRNPVKFARIGSKFSTGRHHPILHRIRAHKGVDYIALSGTPVKAAGDGKVVFIGRNGGYGNLIELQHGNKYSTRYAHLSNFAQGIKKDVVVKQGQVIGYVGRTGLATGDHLHYEFRVDGIHRDPLTVQLPKSMPLANKYRSKFLSYAQQMISLLNENDTARFAKN